MRGCLTKLVSVSTKYWILNTLCERDSFVSVDTFVGNDKRVSRAELVLVSTMYLILDMLCERDSFVVLIL